jgi:2-polyprenyl-3-methyl-5-hydroxy-6-metoxy-1,4-benzoquinol methylase
MPAAPSILPVCPACASESISDRKVYNGHLLKECAQCGLVFTAERSFPQSLYDQVYSGVGVYRTMMKDAQHTHDGAKGLGDLWWFKRKALRLLSTRQPQGHLLDLGSGPGTFLMVAQRQFGYEVQGIEPTAEAAEAANNYRVPTFCGTAEEFAKQNPGTFDAVTSFEVLEHLADPLSFLVAAKTLLKRTGWLVLSVPNLDDPYCLEQQITPAMPPIHINFFARRSLGPLLNRAGLKVRKFYSLPIPSSSVRNIYGRNGLLIRLPYLALKRLTGSVDGTTLLVLATPYDR